VICGRFFGGVLLAVGYGVGCDLSADTGGVHAGLRLGARRSACSHLCRGWRLVLPDAALFALFLAAAFGD
jgi:hypothetical protein